MKKQYFLSSLFLMLFALPTYAQIINNIELPTSINNTGNAPDASAILDVQSTTQGMLVPRMNSTQRMAISSPVEGLLVFDTTTGTFQFYDGSNWVDLSAADTDWQQHTNGIYNIADNVGIGVQPNVNYKLYTFRNYGDTGAGNANIYAHRYGADVPFNGGTDWTSFGVDAAIKGDVTLANIYSAAIYGSSYLDFTNSAAVLGTNGTGDTYGALGYKDGSSNLWAGYFEGDVKVNGSLTLEDGTEGAGKVLTSDANGQATWQNAPSDGDWADHANGIYNDIDNVAIGGTPNLSNKLSVLRDFGFEANTANIYAYRNGTSNPASGGIGWYGTGVDAAINGEIFWGNSYSAAIYGSSYLDFANSAVVLGAHGNGTTYGALGFKDGEGTLYAGYFKGDVKVNGSLTLEDGTEGTGKVLTSDANGQATWQNAPSVGNWTDHANGIYNDIDNVAIGITPQAGNTFTSSRGPGDIGANKASIYGSRLGAGEQPDGGIDWTRHGVDAAIKGDIYWGNNYSAAVYGSSYLDFANSAAVLGTNGNGDTYGALGYNDGSSNLWAGYFKGEVFIKQNASGAGISFENHDSNAETWRFGISSFTNNFLFYYNNTIKSYINQSDGAYVINSDRSLKTNIEYLEGVLPKVMALKPAKYHYKSAIDAPQKSHGFIAQEVQAIFPELVRESEDGKLALAYDDFAILAIKSIQEQQTVIEVQAQKNADLEKRLEKLEALLLEKE